MGYKIYGEEEPKRSRRSEFIEWFVGTLLWFPYAIGGWLVHFGMNLWWMFAATFIIATITAWKLSSPETQR